MVKATGRQNVAKSMNKSSADVLRQNSYVHMADGVNRTEPGSLPFDYRPGFKALRRAGYSGWLTVESKATDDPDAALARAINYVQRQWTEA